MYMKGEKPMFTHIKDGLPTEEGLYICRVIDKKTGKPIYRLDEFRRPSIFQKKYEGIEEGFQLDFGSENKTQAWKPIDDDYHNHIIDLSSGSTTININGYDMNLVLGDLELSSNNDQFKDYNIKNYDCPLTCVYKGQTSINIIKIYYSEETKNLNISWRKTDPLFVIIDNSGDNTLIDFKNEYLFNHLKRVFKEKIKDFSI